MCNKEGERERERALIHEAIDTLNFRDNEILEFPNSKN